MFLINFLQIEYNLYDLNASKGVVNVVKTSPYSENTSIKFSAKNVSKCDEIFILSIRLLWKNV